MAEDRIYGFKINKDGYGIVPKSVMQDKDLNIAAKAVYAYFCSYTGTGDCCFPTRKKICFDLGISNDSLSKYIRQLVDNGYLLVEQVKENGRFSHNIYTLPDVKLPCPKISDTEDTEYGKMDTKNNNSKNNKEFKINSNDIGETQKRKRFVPPTLEEVKEYCLERKNSVDAERFIDYYTSKGWVVGKSKMKDWKAAVRTWEKNGYSNSKSNNSDAWCMANPEDEIPLPF